MDKVVGSKYFKMLIKLVRAGEVDHKLIVKEKVQFKHLPTAKSETNLSMDHAV